MSYILDRNDFKKEFLATIDTTHQKGALSRGQEKISYPVTHQTVTALRNSGFVNPCVGKSHGLKISDDFDIIQAALDVLETRLMVTKGIYPEDIILKHWPFNFPIPMDEENKEHYWPKAFKNLGLSKDDPAGLADIVFMDDPIDLQIAIKKALTNPKYGGSSNIADHTSDYIQFLETVVDTNETITDGQKRYAKKGGQVKYFFGLARPEEIISQLFPAITPELITAYKTGCPAHPEGPPWHYVLALGGGRCFLKDFDIDRETINKEVLLTQWLWGVFRILAGVHYYQTLIMAPLICGYQEYLQKPLIEKWTA